MKTAEQAAVEYAESLEDNDYTIETEAAFKAGVEFAQRWVSVDEAQPEYDERVLVKIGDNFFIGTYYKDWGQWFDLELFYSATGTSWRQIDIK